MPRYVDAEPAVCLNRHGDLPAHVKDLPLAKSRKLHDLVASQDEPYGKIGWQDLTSCNC
jgi:hypothetical protein